MAGANGSAVITDNNSTSIEVYKDSTISLSATASAGDYGFVGWYTNPDFSGDAASSDNPWNLTVTEDATYYAYFRESRTTTIYFEPRGYEKHFAYVYNNVDYSSTKHFSNEWAGTEMSVDADTGYYKFEYTGYETGTFYVIVNNGSSNSQYPGSNQTGLDGTLGGTYLFKAGEPTGLVDFDPADLITVEVTAETGGTATVNGKTSVKVLNGDTVQLVATPTQNSGYGFAGWYNGSTQVGTSSETTKTVTINATAGSTVTYTAKFEKTGKTLYIGLGNYSSTYNNVKQVYYWCDSSPDGTINLSDYSYTTKNYKVDGYFDSQSFRCYTITLPEDVKGIKFRNGNSWYGGDVTNFDSSMRDLIFEYSNGYVNFRVAK